MGFEIEFMQQLQGAASPGQSVEEARLLSEFIYRPSRMTGTDVFSATLLRIRSFPGNELPGDVWS